MFCLHILHKHDSHQNTPRTMSQGSQRAFICELKQEQILGLGGIKETVSQRTQSKYTSLSLSPDTHRTTEATCCSAHHGHQGHLSVSKTNFH